MGRYRKLCLTISFGLFLPLILTTAVLAETVHIAVAANFAAPAKSLIEVFELSSGHKGIVSLGSSGKFYAQILYGAPFDVFFSADRVKPEALESRGLVTPGSRRTYAIGRLVLWSSRINYIDGSPSVLKDGDFSKLALANPRLAPYGAAAVQVLEALDLRTPTEAKWVQGENIAQTYQFVDTGNADLGFVALSQVMLLVTPGTTMSQKGLVNEFRHGSGWVVPDHLHDPIRQDVVLLKRAEGNPAANAFMVFLQSPTAQKIIESYGYSTSS